MNIQNNDLESILTDFLNTDTGKLMLSFSCYFWAFNLLKKFIGGAK